MKQMARQCSRGVEDLVEVIVSRLEIEAQLSRLRLVEFITGLQRSRELMTFKKGQVVKIIKRTCMVERVSSQETSFALPCQSTGKRLSLLRASARS